VDLNGGNYEFYFALNFQSNRIGVFFGAGGNILTNDSDRIEGKNLRVTLSPIISNFTNTKEKFIPK